MRVEKLLMSGCVLSYMTIMQLFKDHLDIPEKIQLIISMLLRLSIGFAIGLAAWRMEWIVVFVASAALIATFLPSMIRRKYDVYLPVEFEFLTVLFVYATLYLGEIHSYYTRFWWWDSVLHGGSALVFGVIGFMLVYVLNQEARIHLNMKPGFVALFAFTFALSIGALWEIFEFAMDGFLGLRMQKSGLVDTMWDLIIDAGGALITTLLGYVYLKGKYNSVVFDRLVRRFVEKNPRLFKKKR
jgi:hypothetical protein